jgi:hypothetical protein
VLVAGLVLMTPACGRRGMPAKPQCLSLNSKPGKPRTERLFIRRDMTLHGR